MIDPVIADQIIAGLLASPIETRSVEFKPSIPWNNINQQNQLQDIVKSILGMSNVKDGGKIILGVPQNPDRTFSVKGMDGNHLATYDQDNIYTIVRSFGNPQPRFEIRNIEYQDKYFIVFFVQEFLYSPVICTRNGKNNGMEPLVSGSIYIRTHKPETKKVDNETEMREVINLAIDKEIDLWTPRIEKLSGKKQSIILGRDGYTDTEFLDELKDIK